MRAPTLALVALVFAPVAWAADGDGDGIEDAADNCPYVANFDQADAGGPIAAAPDGIGDLCQCGDVDGDGRPTVRDATVYRRALLLRPPGLTAPEKCDVAPAAGACDADDVARLRQAIAGGPLGIEPLCQPALPPPGSCGNGVVEAPEACDGADLGGQTCTSLGYLGGTLACSGACAFDTSACIPFGQPGDACSSSLQCDGGLPCVDGVCCTSACTGTCARCDLPGLEGSCANLAAGTDPDAECGTVSCAGYYAGWSGDQCLAVADAPAELVACDGVGACQAASELCPTQPSGTTAVSCDATCQDPTAGTCTGVVPGACTNVNPGTQTCGAGVCAVTVNQCVNGVPNACTPNSGNATTETCNDIDDNCDGAVDNGAFADAYEPGGSSCDTPGILATVGSDQTISLSTLTVFSAGDVDVYRINANETDSSCACCDFFCTDEDYQFGVALSVPADAGSYELCGSYSACAVPGTPGNCVVVASGSTQALSWNLDGGCPGVDNFTFYVSVRGSVSPGYECRPYTLTYTFDAGRCF